MSYNIDKGQVYREDDGEVVGDIREITAAEALKILMEGEEYEKNKMQRLEELEKEFREVGYTEDAIKAIEKVDGAIEIADFINNLESEKSYWGE